MPCSGAATSTASVAAPSPDATIGSTAGHGRADARHHKGHAGMRDFFRILAERTTHVVQPPGIHADGNKVFVAGHYTWS